MRSEHIIGGKQCYIYENNEADVFLIQAVNKHELELLDREVEIIKELVPDTQFMLVAFLIEDWNSELSPWVAPAVFGNDNFGDGAADTLDFIMDKLIPTLSNMYRNSSHKDFYIGGYSLAGLFSLWASYQTDIFSGIAAVSPSVWFPNWDNYMSSHFMQTTKVYLSLGDKEEKTRNKTMSRVGDNIRKQYELLSNNKVVKECALEWNQGNHFVDSEIRMAKGFAWLLNGK